MITTAALASGAEAPDWVTANRALRWPDDGEMCRWHERRDDVGEG